MDTVHEAFHSSEIQQAKRQYNNKDYIEPTKKEPNVRIRTPKEQRFIIQLKNKSRILPRPYMKGNPDNVLVIGDTHLPFDRPGYLEFCRETQEKFNCGTVLHIGDEVDNCALSQFERDPDGLSAMSEYELALERLKDWYEVFPNVKVCIGNHTARPFRMARTIGIPSKFIRDYSEVWEAPRGWEWAESFDIHGVHYTHGTGSSGAQAALKRAMQLRQPVVMGHLHKEAGLHYNVSSKDAIFGLLTGCGISDDEYAFYYAKDDARKSIIACAVVLDKGKLPLVKLMPL
jgi:predicted phosphodiesterase